MPAIGDRIPRDKLAPTQRELDKLTRKFPTRKSNKGGK